MVIQLGVEEPRQVADAVGLCILDVLHTSVYVLGGLLVLGFGATKLVLNAEVITLGLLHFGCGGIEG